MVEDGTVPCVTNHPLDLHVSALSESDGDEAHVPGAATPVLDVLKIVFSFFLITT